MSERVSSADGTGIAYYVTGRAGGPTVVAVHGYPDNHGVWDGVAAELGERFRVVTYDVRGAGESDRPAGRDGFRIPHLVDDLCAVLDAVWDGEPVYLVGHDWGSVQSWPALTDHRITGRVAGYVSISGPSLDHTAAWMRRAREHPGLAARQLAHSYYIALFQVPRLAEAAISRGVFERLLGPAPYRTRRDALNGLELYRANVAASIRRPRAQRIDIPVLVVALEQDAFLLPQVCLDAPAPWVGDLRTRTIPGEHWILSGRPDIVADCIREFVATFGDQSN